MDEIRCVADDVDDPHLSLADSIRVQLLGLPALSPYCCIYRVPRRIREANEKAYTPQIVSIGPLHHGKEELQGMEEFKLRCLHAFLNRTSLTLEHCIRVIELWEERARRCYAERIELKTDAFVKMILLDSAFIIEVMLSDERMDTDSDYSSERRVMLHVQEDIILLENQLPFFIIEDLFNHASHSNPRLPSSFLELSISYFDNLLPFYDSGKTKSSSEVKHFVDLLRSSQLASSLQSPQADKEFIATPTATELQEAGMTIKGSSCRLTDIQYTRGELKIPTLKVDDSTDLVLRNVIAMEICHYYPKTYIIDYLFFMDSLIDSAKDVVLLSQNGVINSVVGDNTTVATLFNNLCSNVTMIEYYYHGISKDVTEYCHVSWHKWKAILRRDYFSTPWRIISTIAAVVLLVLTLIQTIKVF